MNSNWLNAFQTRFTLTPANITLLNNFPPDGKSCIIEAAALASDAANKTGMLLPVLMSIEGFASSSQSAASEGDPAPQLLQGWKFKVKGKLYCKWDVDTQSEKWEYEVRVTAHASLC